MIIIGVVILHPELRSLMGEVGAELSHSPGDPGFHSYLLHMPPDLLAVGCPSFAWTSAMYPTFILGCPPSDYLPPSHAASPSPEGHPCPRWLWFPLPVTDGFGPHEAVTRLKPPSNQTPV